ncbi:MAG: xanthine dehydrogenase family protein molybdopterin-binding subunit [Parvibaculaceae bacterium]
MAIRAAPAPDRNMGRPEPRIDGRLKVTGMAPYAADFPADGLAHGWLVTSAIARGRIAAIDTRKASAVPGVLHVMTHENRPSLGEFAFFGAGGEAATAKPPLGSDRIDHEGEIVALVVAESLETAREAADAVTVRYEEEQPAPGFDAPGVELVRAEGRVPQHKDPKAGDFDAAFREAEVKLDFVYRTPTQHHNPIELFSTTCRWDGATLIVHEPSQWVVGLQNGLARELGMDAGAIEVHSPYIGGAFGSKGSITPRTALVALAAKLLARPVRLVVTRDQGFTTATYRAETRHRIRLGAARDGRIAAYGHESWELSSRSDDYVVAGSQNSVAMYGIPNVLTRVNIAKADRNTPGFMRSPPEVPYIYALESAIDELSYMVGLDPVELRRRNDTMVNPVNGAPYTSRSLMQCFDAAAKAFGWETRRPGIGAMTDGDWLVGLGCAMATYPTQMAPAAARVRLAADGKVRVQIASQDVGTGAYTVIGQQAADMLAVPIEKVTVELGRSDLPPGPVAGGSVTTASSCSAVRIACDAIVRRLAGNKPPDSFALKDGLLVFENESKTLKQAFGELGLGAIEEYGEYLPDGLEPTVLADMYAGRLKFTGGPGEKSTMFAFGAEFVEVRVHRRTRVIRVPRMVGAFAAGRIMNPRTARSQLMGGMIWGISSALHEATEIDPRNARYINDNLADYLVPVNADIDEVEVILLPEEDGKVNPAGVKGLGELGNVGTAAAVANAVYHATGRRIRDLPIRIEKLL